MTWRVERSPTLRKWLKRERISGAELTRIEGRLADFQNGEPRQKREARFFQVPGQEGWVVRMTDKQGRKGKSGGFRVVFTLDLDEGVLTLHGIVRRPHLKAGREAGRYDRAFRALIADLKRKASLMRNPMKTRIGLATIERTAT